MANCCSASSEEVSRLVDREVDIKIGADAYPSHIRFREPNVVFVRRMRFLVDDAPAFLGARPVLNGKRFLRKLLNYCLRVGYLGAPLPPVDDVLKSLASTDASARSNVPLG